jgi:biopolymer transport protein ExbD
MVTVPLMLGGVHVNLPRAQGERMNTQESPLIVTLDADNRVYVDEVMIPEDQYHATFQDLARKSENGEVFLRGDGEIKYARIMDLMADLGRAGFSKVVLVAELDEKSNGGKLPIRHQAQSR